MTLAPPKNNAQTAPTIRASRSGMPSKATPRAAKPKPARSGGAHFFIDGLSTIAIGALSEANDMGEGFFIAPIRLTARTRSRNDK